MSEEKSRSLDLLGIKPIAESINKVTSAAVDGSAAFLSRICLPAAEEYGLLLRDRVRNYRAANIAAITKKAEENLLQAGALENAQAHPRLVSSILEEGSWADDPVVQDLWAGLLSSSCTESGDDDSNLVFINLLSSLTKLQARILNLACEVAQKRKTSNGLIIAEILQLPLEALVATSGESDIQRLDRELDHLRELGLITHGIDVHSDVAEITPKPLMLHLYVRCHGSRESPIDYFKLSNDE